jgi:glyoxylase-like metal-dependent hydrolase (beta-lactamase superfamily II)
MNPFTFRTTTHPTTLADLGTPISSSAMEALIDEPGPVQLTTIGSSWSAPLKGLLNLKDPKAVHAGLHDHKEPIQIYLQVVRHPNHGFFLIDTGVAEKFAKDPAIVGVGWVLRKHGGIERMEGQPSTAAVIASQDVPLTGVILSHIHLDHVSGLPDIPQKTPIYIGPNEANASLFLNMFAKGTNDRMLAGRPPLKEFDIPADPDGKLEGAIDVFGDSSFFAILTPGHTVGHLSFLARTTTGPVLLATDVSHTRWGWDHGVEPGTYLWNREKSHKSLVELKALSDRHPAMTVKAGHQP